MTCSRALVLDFDGITRDVWLTASARSVPVAPSTVPVVALEPGTWRLRGFLAEGADLEVTAYLEGFKDRPVKIVDLTGAATVGSVIDLTLDLTLCRVRYLVVKSDNAINGLVATRDYVLNTLPGAVPAILQAAAGLKTAVGG